MASAVDLTAASLSDTEHLSLERVLSLRHGQLSRARDIPSSHVSDLEFTCTPIPLLPSLHLMAFASAASLGSLQKIFLLLLARLHRSLFFHPHLHQPLTRKIETRQHDKMTYLIPLTPERASTTFAGVPCTDASHFDITQTVRPGDWDSPASCPLKHGIGHRRCKVPRKLLVIKESTGEFAITHGKAIEKVEHRFMQPTAEVREFFRKVGVPVGQASKGKQSDSSVSTKYLLSFGEAVADSLQAKRGPELNGQGPEKVVDGEWELVDVVDESEYVMV